MRKLIPIKEFLLRKWAKEILKGNFKIEFITESGKPNDDAPDSIRQDLHTDGKGESRKD